MSDSFDSEIIKEQDKRIRELEAERDAVVKDAIKAALAWKAESVAACDAACDAIRAKTIEECAEAAEWFVNVEKFTARAVAHRIRALAPSRKG
jgi:hypothetical protein